MTMEEFHAYCDKWVGWFTGCQTRNSYTFEQIVTEIANPAYEGPNGEYRELPMHENLAAVSGLAAAAIMMLAELARAGEPVQPPT